LQGDTIRDPRTKDDDIQFPSGITGRVLPGGFPREARIDRGVCRDMQRRFGPVSDLILVKHSAPEIVPAIPAHEWRLSREGRLRSARLAERLRSRSVDALFSSPEPKALETARMASRLLEKPLEIVDGLHEHDRSNVLFNAGSLHDSVAHFFRHAAVLVLGKETADQAHARFAAAVEGILAEHVDRNIAVIAHGTVISLYVARAAGLDPMCLVLLRVGGHLTMRENDEAPGELFPEGELRFFQQNIRRCRAL
jgi:broad specificity phosphatase PhoE